MKLHFIIEIRQALAPLTRVKCHQSDSKGTDTVVLDIDRPVL